MMDSNYVSRHEFEMLMHEVLPRIENHLVAIHGEVKKTNGSVADILQDGCPVGKTHAAAIQDHEWWKRKGILSILAIGWLYIKTYLLTVR